jgi:hypothetical protein
LDELFERMKRHGGGPEGLLGVLAVDGPMT